MRAASQLPGRGPTDVDDAPTRMHVIKKSRRGSTDVDDAPTGMHVNQKSNYDYDDDEFWLL